MFEDRLDAGKKLAEKLKDFRDKNIIILAIPRGGVVVGSQVARSLNAPLDVIIARKLGYTYQPELGIGAISENGAIFLDKENIGELDVSDEELERIKNKEEEELRRRIQIYRKGRSLPKLKGKTVILVDDGLATGVSAKAAISAIKKEGAEKITLAIPVCSTQTAKEIREKVDSLTCVLSTNHLQSVGGYYKNFEQVSDQKVLEILSGFNARRKKSS